MNTERLFEKYAEMQDNNIPFYVFKEANRYRELTTTGFKPLPIRNKKRINRNNVTNVTLMDDKHMLKFPAHTTPLTDSEKDEIEQLLNPKSHLDRYLKYYLEKENPFRKPPIKSEETLQQQNEWELLNPNNKPGLPFIPKQPDKIKENRERARWI
jgi:hypothetical protein